MKQFRLLIDGKNSAPKNMAVDAALLENFSAQDTPILRFYSWEKSFTVGTSQDPQAFDFKDLYDGNYAKRITGGGVLFHGCDLSYSLVLPTSDFKDMSIKESYEKICSFLINFYKNLGLKTCYAKDDTLTVLHKHAFCQVGFEAYDIIVNRKKIGGNAQRRTKKAIFQHGSIPLYDASKSALTHERFGTSLQELGIELSYNEATDLLVSSFESTFNTKGLRQ